MNWLKVKLAKSKMKLPTSICFPLRWVDSSRRQRAQTRLYSGWPIQPPPTPILSKKSWQFAWPIPTLPSKRTNLISSVSWQSTWANSFTVIRRQLNFYSISAPCTPDSKSNRLESWSNSTLEYQKWQKRTHTHVQSLKQTNQGNSVEIPHLFLKI